MANAKKSLTDGQNENGVNVEAKEMLLSNGKKETKVTFTDRLEIVLLKDTTYQKEGKVYSPSKVKALWLIEKGIAKATK